MNFSVCSFNTRLLVLLEAPKHFSPAANSSVLTLRQSYNIFPNFIQCIAADLEKICRRYRIVAILYQTDSVMMNNFPNGTEKTITYYVYYTSLEDCHIDDVFFGELLQHLTTKLGMSYYVAQVFLQSLRHGFNKPDARVDALVRDHKLNTEHDNLEEIRRLVLQLRPDQKRKIEMLVHRNSTFNAILPNMLLLNVTNCIQQDSLSIKHDTTKANKAASSSSSSSVSSLTSIATTNTSKDGTDDEDENGEDDNDDIFSLTSTTSSSSSSSSDDIKFRTYVDGIELLQHHYYCSYGDCVVVEADIQLSVFNKLIMKNLIAAFLIKSIRVDQLHCFLYIDVDKFSLFSKVRVHGKILQYKIRNQRFNPCTVDISYNIQMHVPHLYGAAPLIIGNTKTLNETFKSKIKVVQMYLIVCENLLRRILAQWNCICKIVRVLASPYTESAVFYHILIYVHETNIDFLYRYLPANGLGCGPCKCTPSLSFALPSTSSLPTHSQQMWYMRPCAEILFHTHFDWTVAKIHNDYVRYCRQFVDGNADNANVDIFRLYDIHETGNSLSIAHLLETKVFKATIENMTTFRFFNETGLLYPFSTTGHEELYIYTLIKMTRIVYRCIVLPLIKMGGRLSTKNLVPSKFSLNFAFIDDPLTPTTSVRGPQTTRNLKSIETSDKVFDTKVINVTMLMNSYNLCGSESVENAIKM